MLEVCADTSTANNASHYVSHYGSEHNCPSHLVLLLSDVAGVVSVV